MKHSPAPWKAEEFWLNWGIHDANGNPVVYELAGGDVEPINAALIAAAPDLLEALKQTLASLEKCNGMTLPISSREEWTIWFEVEIALIKSAIAKAEGK